jgi:hypothetical protein
MHPSTDAKPDSLRRGGLRAVSGPSAARRAGPMRAHQQRVYSARRSTLDRLLMSVFSPYLRESVAHDL